MGDRIPDAAGPPRMVVDGDLLATVIADTAHPCLTVRAARAAREHAERALAAAHRAGMTVLRGPDSQPWTPADGGGS